MVTIDAHGLQSLLEKLPRISGDASQMSKCPNGCRDASGRTRRPAGPGKSPSPRCSLGQFQHHKRRHRSVMRSRASGPRSICPSDSDFFRMHFKCPNVQTRAYHAEIIDINQNRGVLGGPTGKNLCFISPSNAKRKAPTVQIGASKVMLLRKTYGLTIAPRL